jgi:outer membrane protein assembly factor BamB
VANRPRRSYRGSPAVGLGFLYVATAAGKIYAVRESDGTISWEADTPAGVSSTPAVGPDAVYVVDDNGTAACYQ